MSRYPTEAAASAYAASGLTVQESRTVYRAMKILEERALRPGSLMSNPMEVACYLRLLIGLHPVEEYHVLYLDCQHRLIESVCMGRGTVNYVNVYPREIAKAALERNAVAVILAHNHPSGMLTPSEPDIANFRHMKAALAVLDIQVLDSVVVTSRSTLSIAMFLRDQEERRQREQQAAWDQQRNERSARAAATRAANAAKRQGMAA